MTELSLRYGRTLATTAILACGLPGLASGQAAVAESFPGWSGGAAPSIRPGMVRRQCVVGHFNQDDRTDLACHTPVGGDWRVSLSTGSGWETTRWTRGPAPGPWIERQCVPGDFNGDGGTDLACYMDPRTGWHMSLSHPDGYTFPVWRNGPTIGEFLPGQCLTGHFDQNRFTDLACRTPNGGPWQLALSTGSGWQRSTWSSGPTPEDGAVHLRCVTGRFNDDEMTDLACHHANGIWRMALSSSRGYSFPSWGNGARSMNVADECVTGQFNSDDRTDLACYTGTRGDWVVMQSTGRGWRTSSWNDGPALQHPLHEQCLAGNLNRDLLTDLACYTGSDGTWHLWLSSTNGYAAGSWSRAPAPEWPIDHQCVAADFTGDAVTDLACYGGVGDVWDMALSP